MKTGTERETECVIAVKDGIVIGRIGTDVKKRSATETESAIVRDANVAREVANEKTEIAKEKLGIARSTCAVWTRMRESSLAMMANP